LKKQSETAGNETEKKEELPKPESNTGAVVSMNEKEEGVKEKEKEVKAPSEAASTNDKLVVSQVTEKPAHEVEGTKADSLANEQVTNQGVYFFGLALLLLATVFFVLRDIVKSKGENNGEDIELDFSYDRLKESDINDEIYDNKKSFCSDYYLFEGETADC